jgi:hypothetical protein
MGLLDDAIREHLELKRRRGADAEEVTRLEQEALGPPQRGEFAGSPAPAEPGGEPPAPEGEAAVDEPAPEPADEPAVEPEPEPRDEAGDDWPEAPPAPPGEAEAPAGDEASVRGSEREEVVLDQPTVEYTAPAEPPVGEPAPDETAGRDADDVLEETPDFLQETPEHDRLWFEQKPPRDFDLDR